MITDSIIKQPLTDYVHKLLIDPINGIQWTQLLLKTLRDLETEEYPDKYLDAIYQKPEQFRRLSLEDAYAFLQVHTCIKNGEVAIFSIPVGEAPHADRLIALNQAALDHLCYPFSATFSGGTQGADGCVSWSSPIHGVVFVDGELLAAILPPSVISLEVGYLSPRKSMAYICWGHASNGLAHWPYGSDKITVFSHSFLGERSVDFEKWRLLMTENLTQFVNDIERNPWQGWNKHRQVLYDH